MKNNETMNDRILSKQDISKAAWRYIFWHQCAQNYERMQGLAFGHVLADPLAKLYPDKKEYTEALVRHVQYYNSNPNLGALVPGITLALEEGRAMHEPIDVDLIVNTKTALMGPLAGIGDPLIGSVYISIVASICIGLSQDSGSLIGPLLYLVLSTGVLVAIKYFCFVKGYELGMKAVKVLNGTITELATTALSIIGVFTVGGITSSIVKMPISWTFVSGDSSIVAQDILNKVMPGVLPFALTIFVWYLYQKKRWTPIKALLLVVILSFICVALGIMG